MAQVVHFPHYCGTCLLVRECIIANNQLGDVKPEDVPDEIIAQVARNEACETWRRA